MPGIAEEGPGVRQHPHEVAEKAQVRQGLHLLLHAALGAVEPPDGAVLDLAGNLVGLEAARQGPQLGVVRRIQGVDQAAAKAVAAAHSVDDVELILLGEAVFIGSRVVEHGAPAVVKGGVGLLEGNGSLLKAKFVRQLLGNALVAFPVDLPGGNIRGLGLDAEDVLGGLAHLPADVRHVGAQGWGDAGESEPVGPGGRVDAVLRRPGGNRENQQCQRRQKQMPFHNASFSPPPLLTLG